MNSIIISREVDPYYNLALEEELLYQVEEGDTFLYLWQNEKTVVIGRNQNPWLECDLDYLKEEGIKLARRISGGGAVFHDLGNLNFTFITRKAKSNLEKQLSVLAKGLKFLDIDITYSGRNDLLTQGKKFSGHAFYEEGEYYFHHGTLMFDVDLSYLSKVLTPPKLKLKSKGINSVKSRVINLKYVKPSITLVSLQESIIESFKQEYGQTKENILLSKESYIPLKFHEYQDEKWIYGETPSFDMLIEERVKEGILQLALTITNGKIAKVEIFSDAIGKIDFEKIKEVLIDREIDEKEIRELVHRI